jgi:hypothetical protein
MTVLDDFSQAIAGYPVDNVDLEFVELEFAGDVLNKSETAQFRIKVTNRGPLNMTQVRLHIEAQHGARVADGVIAAFADDFDTGLFSLIPANGGSAVSDGAKFKLRAPNAVQDAKTLMRATLKEWDVNPDYLLVDNTTALDEPKANYVSAVADQ